MPRSAAATERAAVYILLQYTKVYRACMETASSAGDGAQISDSGRTESSRETTALRTEISRHNGGRCGVGSRIKNRIKKYFHEFSRDHCEVHVWIFSAGHHGTSKTVSLQNIFYVILLLFRFERKIWY